MRRSATRARKPAPLYLGLGGFVSGYNGREARHLGVGLHGVRTMLGPCVPVCITRCRREFIITTIVPVAYVSVTEVTCPFCAALLRAWTVPRTVRRRRAATL